MLDDLRNHDPRPSGEELAWMQSDPFSMARQIIAAAAVATIVAVSLSLPSVDTAPAVTAAVSR